MFKYLILMLMLFVLVVPPVYIFAAGVQEQEEECPCAKALEEQQDRAKLIRNWLIFAAYVFIATMVGTFVKIKITPKTKVDKTDAGFVNVLSGVFWPVAVLFWSAYFLTNYLIKMYEERMRSHPEEESTKEEE